MASWNNDIRLVVRENVETFVRSKYSILIFVATGLALFSREFLQFRVILSSTDNLFAHYPNIIFGYRSLRSGALPMWNPYIFAGTDFTTSMHNHMLDPLNWVLLLFPESYILHVLTAIIFAEICFVGILSFKIASRYLRDPWAALLVALVAQLCQFPWFTTTTLIGTHLLVLSLASIFFIVTWENRRAITNYVLLSLCFFEIFMKGHVGYIAAFGLPIIAAFVLKTWPQGVIRPWRGLTPVVAASAFTGIVMSAARIVPVVEGLIHAGYTGWLSSFPGNNGYFTLTAINPQIFGLMLGDAAEIFGKLGDPGRHTQFHQLMYFGIAPFFILLMALRGNFGTRTFFATLVMLGVALMPIYLIQPLSDIFNLLFFPLIHDIVPRTLTGYLVPFVLGLAFYRISDQALRPDSAAICSFVVVVALFIAASIAMEIKVLHASGFAALTGWPFLFNGLRVTILVVLAGAVAMAWRLSFNEANARKISNVAALVVLAVAVTIGIFGAYTKAFSNTFATMQGYIYELGAALWTFGAIGIARIFADGQPVRKRVIRSTVGCFMVATLMLVIPAPERHGGRDMDAVVIAAVMGAVLSLLLAACTVEIFVRYREDLLTRSLLLPVLVVLTAGDLMFAAKNYEYVGAQPFVASDSLYPNSSRVPDAPAQLAAWRNSPNLPDRLKNPNLSTDGYSVRNWSLGGDDTKLAGVNVDHNSIGLRIAAGKPGTLFQDVALPDRPPAVSFGAWVRARKAGTMRVMITALSATGSEIGATSAFHTGAGKWEWLTATVSSPDGVKRVRSHVVFDSPATAAVYAPRLVTSLIVTPAARPSAESINVTPSLNVADHGPDPALDFRSYRVNNPYRLARSACGEAFSSCPMVYRLRTYGGVDSVVDPNIYNFLTNFVAPDASWYGRQGFNERLTNPRLLDLLGVGYNVGPDGTVVHRPNALARFSAFEHYEVVPNRSAMLTRLKGPDFDPTTTVLLDRDPRLSSVTNAALRFRPLEFGATNNNTMTLDLNLKRPTIVLFDDSYSPNWQARWNGKTVPVMLANGNFMAVALPESSGTLSFEFRPQPFLRLFKIGAVTTMFVLLLAVYVVVTCWRTHRGGKRSAAAALPS